VTRVLHLITRFIGGGAEKTVEHQIRGLLDAHREYDVRLGFGEEYDPDRVASIQEEGIKTVQFDQIRHYSLFHTVPAVVQVARYLHKHQIQVIHTHSTEAGIIGRWNASLHQ